MASFYQRPSGIFYLSVSFQGNRISRSLGTKSKSVAESLFPAVERDIYNELLNGREKKDISFKDLLDKYLKYDHNLSKSTHEINTVKLNNYLIYGLPNNKTTKAMTIRIINGCNRWEFHID